MRVRHTTRSRDRTRSFPRRAGVLWVSLVVAASACAIAGTTGLDAATSEAATLSPATGSPTAVSIHSWPDGFFGYVNTDLKNGQCGDATVSLMQQVGPTQDAAADKTIATVTTSESGSGDRWMVHAKASGQFYAMSKSESGCAGSVSDTVASESANDLVPPCPSTAPICSFQLSFDTNAYCPSFGASFGMCVGTSSGASVPWTVPVFSLPALYATLLWSGSSNKYLSISGTNVAVLSAISGTVPVSHSPNYTVQDAFAAKWSNPGIHFFTPDIPGVIAGQQGGPLWINFVNGRLGATVHLHGFLYRRDRAGG
jgi:hypothetical protein